MSTEAHTDMQKITVEVPLHILESAKGYVDGGATDAVREALKHFVHVQALQNLSKLRGTYTPSISIEEMRSWEDDDPDNPWNPMHVRCRH